MLLESTQLLWTAQHVLAAEAGAVVPDVETAPPTATGRTGGYRATHKNHPCAKWARATIGNYRWLVALALSLADEYHYRFTELQERARPRRPTQGGRSDAPHASHACEVHVAWLRDHEPPALAAANGPLTWPALAMPLEFKVSPSPVACYRAFYVGSKKARGIVSYTRRDRPSWVD
jgi:hypothetical protein